MEGIIVFFYHPDEAFFGKELLYELVDGLAYWTV